MRMYIHLMVTLICISFFASGCYSRYQVIPDNLEDKVNHQLTFQEIQDNPEAYTDEVVVVGGEVLSVDRLPDATRIEILQLPLNSDFVPANRRTKTEGRLIALSEENGALDPAVLETGVAITIVGLVLGGEKIPIDKIEKEVPVFGIKDLTIWDRPHYWGRPHYRNAFGWGHSYYYPFRPVGPFYGVGGTTGLAGPGPGAGVP
jgi:outer membrane lipoprotein